MAVDSEAMVARYRKLETERTAREPGWRKLSAYCLPEHYPLWSSPRRGLLGGSSGVEYKAWDAIGVECASKLTAAYERLVTPKGRRWHSYEPNDPELRGRADVNLWLDDLTQRVFRQRYASKSGFETAIQAVLQSVAVYGNAAMWVGQRALPGGMMQTFFLPLFIRDVLFEVDMFAELTHVYHRFFLTPEEFRHRFPEVRPPAS